MIPAGPALREEAESRLNNGRRLRGSPSRDRGCVACAANNPANESATIGGQNVRHDEAGNLSEDEDDVTYAYDFENRLVKITGLQEPTIIRVCPLSEPRPCAAGRG